MLLDSSNLFPFKSSCHFRYLNCHQILYSNATALKLGSSTQFFLLFPFLVFMKCQVLNVGVVGHVTLSCKRSVAPRPSWRATRNLSGRRSCKSLIPLSPSRCLPYQYPGKQHSVMAQRAQVFSFAIVTRNTIFAVTREARVKGF